MQEAPKSTIYPKRGRFSNQRKATEASFTLQAKKLLRTSFPSFCSDRPTPPIPYPHLRAGSPSTPAARRPSPPRRPPQLLPSAPAAAPPLHAGGAQLLPSARPDDAAAPPLHAGRRSSPLHASGVQLLPSARPAVPPPLPSTPVGTAPSSPHGSGLQIRPSPRDTAAARDRGRPPMGGSGRGEIGRASCRERV